MSLGPWTAVGTGINRMDAVPMAGFPKGSGGALSHAGMCLGARSVCCLSLLNSCCTLRGMPLTDRLEHRGGFFLYSASTLFFGGSGSESGELPKDSLSSAAASLSSNRIGSLPLFCLTRGIRWPLPRTFSAHSPSRRVRRQSFSCCR